MDYRSPHPGLATHPAATVVVFRDGAAGSPPELLMVQRSAHMRFAGGAAVFPGGRIDPADFAQADSFATENRLEAAARIAAIRETLEETGLMIGLVRPITADQASQARQMLLEQGALAPVLAAMGWRLALDTLIPFAHWCPRWEGAFDTRFYLTDIGADAGESAAELTVDATENSRLFWITAADALAAADAADISVLFPTRRSLERLAQFASFAQARADAQYYPPRMITPGETLRDGETWLTISAGHGYPVLGEPLAGAKRR